MPGSITISNTQRRWKDVYAPAPKIDLTLRCNGEERVKIMNSLGQWSVAGLDGPTSALTVTTTGSAGSFAANKFWEYRYVYVAKKFFPLIENAVTGGGSPAPRSNPSPSALANSTVNTNIKSLSVPTSQAAEISHIWVYRTNYFSTAAEAAAFSTAGVMFFLGEIVNDPNVGTVSLADAGTIVGSEQIENDNFVAPQFQMGLYVDPFFYGFGNYEITLNVTIDATGLLTLADANDRWYDGRNGQIVTLDGVETGGFDQHGSFFFKQLTSTTAKVYNDIALTSPATLSSAGTTTASIRGPATTLYRSKPRNPLSWGVTDLIGEVQVPSLYAFSVGGGKGTCISVVPNVNLLKLDTEAPNKVYTLNLKNAGTPNFESSLRGFADTYCVSNFHSQFSATLERGQLVLWGVDTKNKCILECDGASQIPNSSPVFKTLRDMAIDTTDRHYFHGNYHPRLELNCIFIRTQGSSTRINKIIYMHSPTKQWGIVNCFDMLCSAQIQNPTTNELQLFVGTESGFVGELFADRKVTNWYDENLVDSADIGRFVVTPDVVIPRQLNSGFAPYGRAGFIGNWLSLAATFDGPILGYARVLTAAGGTITVDIILNRYLVDISLIGWPLNVAYAYLGLIEIEIGRCFTGQVPFIYKKLEEFWLTIREMTWHDRAVLQQLQSPTIEILNFYKHQPELTQVPPVPAELPLTVKAVDALELGYASVWGKETQFPIDMARAATIIIRDRNYNLCQIMNYEVKVTPESDGSNG